MNTDNIDKWDLKALFNDEAELDSFTKQIQKEAINFEKEYSNKLINIDDFENIVTKYENICDGIARIMTYVFLIFAKDTNNGSFYAKYELIANEIQNHIIFFEIEFSKLDENLILKHIKKAKKYKYYLTKIYQQKQYQLSKEEEKIILKLSPIGASAFSRLFDEHLSKIKFKFNNEILSEEEILSKLHSSNRKDRKTAQKELTKKLDKSSHLLKYIINIIRKDLAISKELRGYENAESFRHIDNQISQKSVDSMINIVVKNFPLVHKYYKMKSKLLNIKTLKDYDRYAPIDFANNTFEYNSAKKLVIETFMGFSKQFGDIAKRAFEDGWVDSHPKENKRGGAFSHGAVPKAHPYILLNYTNGRRDIFTIAHEFGHAIHQELSKNMGYLNMDTPLTTAETASVFGEMLLFDRMKNEIKGKELLGLYAGKIEDIFSTLFRQVVMTNFERRIHNCKDELEVCDLNKIWYEENKKMFEDSVKLTKNYSLWWSYIPHFIHSPFYCYAYSYGQLLSLTLFGLYKSKKYEDFVAKYTEFLSCGGSKSPKDLVAIFGFDIDDEKFWEFGINEVKKILDEFNQMVNKDL
ncbi:M3 family oligoendopeptidase [Helicobacter sp. MIT 14-3879]|uniref:M3 family oligoendopeptidase n=1 Tax=Helicobacter sp. MIT 14-3879 TaxID=2040649 RepID=UPI000E1F8B4F|nr:M3 family oligoendopeptidase [Helicobacter sp. MIT 14-3879]RDU62628.1 oligoendopeptidase F [Helicobacter sp. MIT 14-3879]